ncbi:MAG: amidohydrolase family protein [Nitriliruptoraceae bacterium]
MTELIDLHSHIYTPTYLDLLRSRTRYPRVATVDGEDRFIIFPEEDDPDHPTGRPIGESFWSVDAKLAYMDEVGIDRTVISLGNPWLDPFNGSESSTHASALNDDLARLPEQTRGRITPMGVLPSHDPEAAAETVRDIAREHRLVGIVTGPSICRRSLDDSELDPVWAALHETRLPWLLHPSDGAAVELLEGFGHSLPIGLAFPFESTIAVTRLVFGGVLQRFGDIRLIVSHAGGTLPFLAGRLDAAWRSDPEARQRLTVAPSSQLAKLHADAIAHHERALHAALDLFEAKLGFGTDHPFSISDAKANLAAIAHFTDFEASIRAGHARELFDM